MYGYNREFTNRFRILKGGKISLVVSSLLAGSIVTSSAIAAELTYSGSNAAVIFNGSTDGITVNTSSSITTALQDSAVGSSTILNTHIINSGTIQVTTTDQGGVFAIDVSDGINGGYILNNAGATISATNTTNSPTGILTGTITNGSYIENSGDIEASSTNTEIRQSAKGIMSVGDLEGSIINNTGATIKAESKTSIAAGISFESSTISTSGKIENSGLIHATTESDAFDAMGIVISDHSSSMMGSVINKLDSEIRVDSARTNATGILFDTHLESAVVTNTGTINVNSDSTTDANNITGILFNFDVTDSQITNSGTMNITANSVNSTATGIFLNGDTYIYEPYTFYPANLAADSTITNSQAITVTNSGEARGMYISGYNYGTIENTQTGSINITSTDSDATGIVINEQRSTIINAGSIEVSSTGESGVATGIQIDGIAEGIITNEEGGTIIVQSVDRAWGINSDLYDEQTIINNGLIEVSSTTYKATGIDIDDFNGEITNNGIITANTTSGQKSAGLFLASAEGSEEGIFTNNHVITATVNDEADYNGYVIRGDDNGGNFRVVNTSSGTMNGNLEVYGELTNAGRINLPWNANGPTKYAYVRDFKNESGGTFSIGFNNDDLDADELVSSDVSAWRFSQLKTNTAEIQNESTIRVDFSSLNNSDINGKRMNDVIIANDLTVGNNLNVTTNSQVLSLSIIRDEESVNDGHTLDLLIGQNENTPAPTNTPHQHTIEATQQIFNLSHNIVELRQTEVMRSEMGDNSGDPLMRDSQLWIKAFGGIGKQNDRNGLNGFDLKTAGFGAGYDAEIGNKGRLGAAFFFTDAEIDVNNVSDTAKIKNYTGMIYGSTNITPKYSFLYQLVYGTQSNTVNRYDDFGYASSDYRSQAYGADLKVMRTASTLTDNLKVTPIVEGSYRMFTTPTYSERGHGTADTQTVQDNMVEKMVLRAGGMFDYKLHKSFNVITDLRVGYDFKHDDNKVTAYYNLLGAGSAETTSGINNGGLVYSAGLALEVHDKAASFDLGYNLEGEGKDFRNHVFSAKFTYKF